MGKIHPNWKSWACLVPINNFPTPSLLLGKGGGRGLAGC